jgi:hypothetical protein
VVTTWPTLAPTPGTVTDMFCRDTPPALTVAPGDTVLVDSLDAAGYLSRKAHPGDQPPTMFSERRGHCLTGPIAVTGAEPGQVLSVRFVSLRPAGWGWTVRALHHPAPAARRRQHRLPRTRGQRHPLPAGYRARRAAVPR